MTGGAPPQPPTQAIHTTAIRRAETGGRPMTDDRPAWARRIRTEREVPGWSQPETVRALRAHAAKELPSHDSLVRRWKSWEAGEHEPDNFYKPLIAHTFGTVTDAFFPRRGGRDGDAEISRATSGRS